MANNYIDANGITRQTQQEIIDELTSQYQEVYGQDINVGSSTPDGSMINIQAQAKGDILDYSVMLYNCFNVDTVGGVPQDVLYKINNVYRTASDYSYVEVNITTTQGVNLQGLDGDYDNPNGVGYTVADGNGNEFILINSTNLTGAGTYTLEFRAKNLGRVECIPNTITTMITVLAGVASVNNPSSQYLTGTDEETDAHFRIRRNQSTAISGKGFIDALYAQLNSIPQVTQAKVWSNNTNATDADGIPPHSVWCIVQGGLNSNIADVIYSNLSYGVGMKGNQTYIKTKADQDNITIKFDRPTTQNLYIKMNLISTTGVPIDSNYIKEQLVNNLSFGIYEPVDMTQLTVAVNKIDSNLYVSSCQVSNNGSTWVNYLLPSSKDEFFVVNKNNINITTGVV